MACWEVLSAHIQYFFRGIILAARLKALGVGFVVIEQNENIGDNWASRHDSLKFHTGKGWAQTPYLRESLSVHWLPVESN
jgi:cation diffusion facilitator CzcD-associated flavoprotein CzcO